MSPPIAIALAAVLIIAGIVATYAASIWQDPPGRHARVPFADPADTADPDGEQFLHALHHEPARTATLPAAGLLPMLPPDPPPGDTRPQPAVWTAWGGKTVTELVDEMTAAYLQVTR